MMKKFFARAFLVLMVILLYLPIFVLAVYSFTDSANIGAIHGFSLKNYETLFTKPDLRAMILGTLVLAVGSALVSTLLGTFGAVGVFYSGRFGNALIGGLNQVPVVNAEVVTAFSLCILLNRFSFHKLCRHAAGRHRCATPKGLELCLLYDTVIIDIKIYTHDVAAFRVSDSAHAAWILNLPNVARIIKMIHYLRAAHCDCIV